MAYLRPPVFARKVFNPIALRLGAFGTQGLVVAGRRTGRPQKVPVIPIEVDGTPYVVSTRGESEWVRNLRAAGRCEVRGHGRIRRYRAVELPVEERTPIIDAYRERAGRTVETYWKQLPEPGDHPVFRLEPEDGRDTVEAPAVQA